jgi:Fic family protein
MGSYQAFIPNPLPPQLEYTESLFNKNGDARAAMRGLSELGGFLPNPDLLIIPYLRKEAELSSRIEGTHATLADLYLFDIEEATSVPTAEVQELRNYVSALHSGWESRLPVSLRLVGQLHEQLLTGVRGEDERPGEYRQIQNYIGSRVSELEDAIYVPPPPERVTELLNQWELFLDVNRHTNIPSLLKIALAHYQFEVIHPFRDGNGRVGRLLISLMLRDSGLLSLPLLYLSAFFERHRADYYDLLQRITERGDWNGWFEFFLDGIITQAEDAISRSRKIVNLRESYEKILISSHRSLSYLGLLDIVFKQPFLRSIEVTGNLNITLQSANKLLKDFEKHGILVEITGRYHHRVYCATELMKLLTA